MSMSYNTLAQTHYYYVGSIPTVTGKTLAENVEPFPSLPQEQVLIRPIDRPIKSRGHIQIHLGNLSPGGAVAKITGKEGLEFTGKAIVFEKECHLKEALNRRDIPNGANLVLLVRYGGPKGHLSDIALITDGRYSDASHGFIVGHITPEAAVGGPIAVIQDGDIITISAKTNMLSMEVSNEEIKERFKLWKAPGPMVNRGVLAKYAALVGDASHGAMTDVFFKSS